MADGHAEGHHFPLQMDDSSASQSGIHGNGAEIPHLEALEKVPADTPPKKPPRARRRLSKPIPASVDLRNSQRRQALDVPHTRDRDLQLAKDPMPQSRLSADEASMASDRRAFEGLPNFDFEQRPYLASTGALPHFSSYQLPETEPEQLPTRVDFQIRDTTPSWSSYESTVIKSRTDSLLAVSSGLRLDPNYTGPEKPSQDIEKGDIESVLQEHESAAPSDDHFNKDWDSPFNRSNPLHWPARRKNISIAALSLFTFITPLASSMFAPAVPQLAQDFNITSSILLEFVVSVYLLGFAFGPLLVAPLSEVYGRYPVYLVGYIGFIAFNVACALAPNVESLVIFRFFAGCFGVTPLAVGGGTIADLFPKEERGKYMGLWALGPMLGPMIGPVGGGYLAAAKGWRWVFWVIVMASGVPALLTALFTSETYAPVLQRRHATSLTSTTSPATPTTPPRTLLRHALTRPTRLLLHSPIVTLTTLYISLTYGTLYLLFTTLTFVLSSPEHYSWSPQKSGLSFIALGIGTILGLLVLAPTSDPLCAYLTRKNGGQYKAEYRLLPLAFGGIVTPLGLALYGWGVEYTLFWPVPCAGLVLVGLGVIQTFMCVQTYLVDAFGTGAASAVAANTVCRSVVAGLLPMAGLSLYGRLGLGWGNTLLAAVALCLVPVPGALYVLGERLRARQKGDL